MHVCNHHFTGFSFHARAGLATGKMAAPRFVAVLPHLPVCCTAWRPWRRLCSRVSHVFDMLVPRIASVPACNVGRSVHCRIVRGLQQKAVLGSLHIIVVRCAHACWLARAICVPIRACVRVRTAVMCCGSLASDRGLGECGQLAYHGAQKERFLQSPSASTGMQTPLRRVTCVLSASHGEVALITRASYAPTAWYSRGWWM